MGDGDGGISSAVLDRLAKEISEIVKLNVQLGIVIGGGNLFRGAELSEVGLDRVTGDYMGMLATLMNSLALRDAFEKRGMNARIHSAIPMSGIVGTFDRRKANFHLDQGRVMVFAAGTGNPLVTTDSAASLRGIEIGADILLKATNVDGVYDKDPSKHKDATLYDHLTFREVLQKELAVMDLAAFCQCRDHKLPIRVFNIHKPGALLNVITGKNEGTLVEPATSKAGA